MITLTLTLTDNNDDSVGLVITGTADHATAKEWEHSKWWRAILGSSILAIRNQQTEIFMGLLRYGKSAAMPDDYAASLRLPPATIKQGDKCKYDGCAADAETLACGRGEKGHPDPAAYCDTHSRIVADEDNPEYLNSCPNCGCLSGVN